jgi:hypothetical protein
MKRSLNRLVTFETTNRRGVCRRVRRRNRMETESATEMVAGAAAVAWQQVCTCVLAIRAPGRCREGIYENLTRVKCPRRRRLARYEAIIGRTERSDVMKKVAAVIKPFDRSICMMMWSHYKLMFLAVQLVAFVVSWLVYRVTNHALAPVAVFFLSMQVSAVLGATWANRLRAKARRDPPRALMLN